MSRYQYMLVESSHGVQTITLNRPEKRNSLSPELIEELTQALGEAATCDCGVIILTGAGSAFCSNWQATPKCSTTPSWAMANSGSSSAIISMIRKDTAA